MKAQTIAVMANDSMSDGPAPGRCASPAAAVPMVAKIPAPMMAPMPRSVTLKAPSSRLSEAPSSAVARMSSRLLVWKMPRSRGTSPIARAPGGRGAARSSGRAGEDRAEDHNGKAGRVSHAAPALATAGGAAAPVPARSAGRTEKGRRDRFGAGWLFV